jgi:hypothetical protein
LNQRTNLNEQLQLKVSPQWGQTNPRTFRFPLSFFAY